MMQVWARCNRKREVTTSERSGNGTIPLPRYSLRPRYKGYRCADGAHAFDCLVDSVSYCLRYGGHRRRGLEIGALATGVDAGVRAASADERDGVVDDAADHLLKRLLDRSHSQLRLPAVKMRAVVSDCQSDVVFHAKKLAATHIPARRLRSSMLV